MYHVYVLYSEGYDKIYIGFTADLTARLNAHNRGENHNWTSRYRPWELVYTESFEEKGIAIRREKELKSSRGRRFIRSMLRRPGSLY